MDEMAVCELVMILRVYALYARSKRVLVFLMTLWTAQIVLSAIGLSTGFAIPLPPGLVGCIYTGTHHLFPCLWVTPLVTDSVIFFMTIWRGRRYLTSFSGSPTNHVFVRDGAIYFLVIFLSNLANTLIFFVTTRGDLKPIAASFNQLLTSTMISRLVLNLRSAGIHEDNQPPGFTIPPISHDLRFAGRTTAAQGFTAISTVTEVTETTEGQKSEDIMLSDFSQAPAMDFKRSFPDPGEDVEFDRTRLVGGPRAV
ncbi:hypothetical protein CC2G_011096 [Coprinopsis cinerea AmutBmut pab1-1]|nr:hypothetical protein CC2G_011096 [Coprinopsis cinerea AmutBmut pab1-1]